MKLKLIVVSIVALLALVAYQQYSKSSRLAPSPSASPSPTSLIIQQTYIDDNWHISFQYPQGWQIVQSGQQIKVYPTGYIEGSFFTIINTVESFSSILARKSRELSCDFSQSSIDQNSGADRNIQFRYAYNECPGPIGFYYLYGNSSNILIQHHYNDAGSAGSVGSVLSSFKFTDNNPFLGWATYIDTKHGFSLKYPANWKVNKTKPTDFTVTFFRPDAPSESFQVEYLISSPYQASSSLSFDNQVEEWKNYHMSSTSFSDQGGMQLSKKTIRIDEKNGIIYLLKAKGDSQNQTFTWIFLPVGNQIMHINYTWSVDKATVEKILSTFKFTY